MYSKRLEQRCLYLQSAPSLRVIVVFPSTPGDLSQGLKEHNTCLNACVKVSSSTIDEKLKIYRKLENIPT